MLRQSSARMNRVTAATATVDVVVEGLNTDGYCIVEGLMARDAVEAARSSLLDVLDATPRGRNDFEGYRTQRVYALFAKTRGFDAAAIDPLVLGVLDRTLEHYQ